LILEYSFSSFYGCVRDETADASALSARRFVDGLTFLICEVDEGFPA
jgi:hypothetical protein